MTALQKQAGLQPGHGGCIKKPIDLVHLATQTLGDQELEAEILGMFLSQSAGYLNEFLQAESIDERKSAAHKIKGTARGLGAWDLACVAEQAEAEGFKGDHDLQVAMQRVADYIREIQD